MDTITELIAALGGYKIVAARFGLTEHAIRQWCSHGRLPLQYRGELLEWCADRKLHVPAHFWTKPRRPGPKPGTSRKRGYDGTTQKNG